MVFVELFLISVIGGTILLTLFMLPVYFIRKKKNPNDPKNTIPKLIISAFLAVTIMSLTLVSGLIKMYFDDLNR